MESLLSDYNHDVSEYMSDLEFDEEDFRSTEDRLNTINHLKGKYAQGHLIMREVERKRRCAEDTINHFSGGRKRKTESFHFLWIMPRFYVN